MKLNCKVIKKVAKPPPPHLYINSPFSGLSPFLATILEPPPKCLNFWEVLPHLIRWEGGFQLCVYYYKVYHRAMHYLWKAKRNTLSKGSVKNVRNKRT